MLVKGQLELELHAQGVRLIGIDEVGRGCIAGPVFAACVSIDYDRLATLDASDRDLIRDSKKLSARQRQRVVESILPHVAIDSCVGVSSVREIERLGINEAIFLAMRRALNKCIHTTDLLLVDGHLEVAGYNGAQRTIVKGDSLCYAIAAASILAKEARDSYMRDQARLYPSYGFQSHVGYGTKAHIASLEEFGICPLHRRNFAPVSQMIPPSKASSN